MAGQRILQFKVGNSRPIGPVQLWGLTEIAKAHGQTRQAANKWTQVEGFPEPVAELASGRVWVAYEVLAWVSRERS